MTTTSPLCAAPLQLGLWQQLTAEQQAAVRALELSPEQVEFAGRIERALEPVVEAADSTQRAGLAVLRGGQVLGFLVLTRQAQAPAWAPAGSVVMSAMRIHPGCQGQGLGSAALRALPAWLQAHWPGSEYLLLQVDAGNAAGRQAYAKAGCHHWGASVPGRIGPVWHMALALRVDAKPLPAQPPQPPLDVLPETLDTERLHIRVARPGDGVVFNAAIAESLPALAPWLGWVTPAPTLAQSEASCRRAQARWLLNEDLMVLCFLKDSGALVGGSGLHNANWTLRQFEVGYWGRSRFGGQGLMTEAVRALADHALQRLGAHRVFLTVDEANRDSWRLAERAGFELEGTLRNERFNLAGALRHTRVYARIPAD
jgi:RimJ/RimL family protein N-acetyltransferase